MCILTGCRVDHGLEPRQSTWSGVEGTVSFLGEWPEDLAEVRAAIFRTYPPTGLSALAGFSDPLLPLGRASYPYRVPAVEGVYEWVIVVARREGEPWAETSLLLGQFVRNPGDATPAPVTVYENLPTSGVDITVDFAHLPEPPPLPIGPDPRDSPVER